MKIAMHTLAAALAVVMAAGLASCSSDSGFEEDDDVFTDDGETEPEEEEGELPIGDIDDLKADGSGWSVATTCKPIPNLTPLSSPEIVVSLDGLTLHLVDKATGFDKVYPIGPGKIEGGLSLTPLSTAKAGQVFYLRMDQPIGKETSNPKQAVWAMSYSCKIWWPDPDTGKKVPVFAGLPFLRLEGAPSLGYAIHGPIDSYTLPNGGKLTRGFVSHGCIRMEAADVVELYGLTLGKKVPVRVQQPVERKSDGTAVDVPQKWLLSECTSDADCNFTGGVCKPNFYAGHSFCTAQCTKYCSYDKFGYPTSFCVADPEDANKGICTLKSTATNNTCRRYPGFELSVGTPRFSQPTVTADVCLPGTQGWIGSPCFSDLDCGLVSGGRCELDEVDGGRPGFCTSGCTKYCPDLKSYASTFCITDDDNSGTCAQKCSLQDECPFGYTCTPGVGRHNDPNTKSAVCL